MTRWAFLEWRLKNVAYRLLGVNPKEGRVAIREPRAEDYLDMLQDLILIKSLKIEFDFKEFKRVINILEGHRNRLAHGVWIKHPSHRSPVLQLTKGKWQPDPTNPKIRAKRVVEPEGVLIRLTELRQFAPLIDAAAKGVEQLEQAVALALEASPQKSK